MQAIRQIATVKDHWLNIVLPNDFIGEKVEVIVLSIDKKNKDQDKEWTEVTKTQFLDKYSEKDSIYDNL